MQGLKSRMVMAGAFGAAAMAVVVAGATGATMAQTAPKSQSSASSSSAAASEKAPTCKGRCATAVFSGDYSDGDMDSLAIYASETGCDLTVKRGASPVGPIRLSASRHTPPKIGAAMTVEQAGSWLDHNC